MNHDDQKGAPPARRLRYLPPYAYDELLEFLENRAIPGVEYVERGTYYRTAQIRKGNESYRGWLSVTNLPDENSLSVTMSGSLLHVSEMVISRVRRLFDTDCDPIKIANSLSVMNALAPDMCLSGIRLPGCFDPFEISVRAVLGQQVTVRAARTLAMRFAHAFGEEIITPFEKLQYVFPPPEVISNLEQPVENILGPLGITGVRARSIFALARAIQTGTIDFSATADPETELPKLSKLPGFGPWTVQYVGMRAFGYPDAFPHTDYGIKKALEGLTEKEILSKSLKWKPWRSYATLLLWNSLKKDKQKKEAQNP
ncbi:MAG TPA: AlkA N-terminal domain-containing protein [Spirochaetota bacterium]|nr:AlkA N-terminal domain-containing protein [Spirochaetota bacterium]OPZ36879.1 MAG: DNA-3-methyladenine glycosylase 2 [Spirochaetes bacterium ADurb.BinA120]HPI14476.1 AlkA N-terminal domain-containing protein [Spirochaetota bacterium]HPO46282.1 AlkA N-terminal domain-containing protein [Spirochaetota bacterium]HPV99176.1 AlkA N-terminal domain-containing protein [Spirochaetota bacterium]